MIDASFWKNKKVLITGHTGFKGSWLCLWLHALGANVTGFSLAPPTTPSLFECAGVEKLVHSIIGDVRSQERVQEAIFQARPDIVIHMAAQPLVRYSYAHPVETFSVNVLGTVHVLEAVREAVDSGIAIRAVINVTTDKCYENKEWSWGYRENDRLGGFDPYSNSKACSELVTMSYRHSFFPAGSYTSHRVALASARAGNVIGGGDWAQDRLIPDCIRAIKEGRKIKIRNPGAIRPWQHVLEPLRGYLMLAQKMWEEGSAFAQSWNFGPEDGDAKPVEWLVEKLCASWGESPGCERDTDSTWHEAHYLKLDCSLAKSLLGWKPLWSIEQALDRVVEWNQAYLRGADMRAVSLTQIERFMREAAG
ncbi:CDP-glucose 4,6-dehydratase [Brevibacillus choshinensis]|uniref:CDP-glucose 4,6-dehydratase n=1 Tax=Brevibacillus choshinensis TaxID=54911 RepID=A0ABX7FT31_BRECH|nr:CDP-glucose 4,6-dehydratase [Brevibacillus choshinensis]QRG69332.1 CDP-glucose 4,6-dehydratase [Brevibacillus choshinensis]